MKILNQLSKILYFGLPLSIKLIFYKYTSNTQKYVSVIYNYFEKYVKDNNTAFLPISKEKHIDANPIWYFWWQGYESMPQICKVCYHSLIKNIPDNTEIHFITKDNYSDYLNIPNVIIDKLGSNVFSLTLFSDLVRNALLTEYGGLWVDSTVYISNPIPASLFSIDGWWSIKGEYDKKDNLIGRIISKNQWCGFIQMGSKNNCVNSFVYKYLYTYMYKERQLLNYYIQNFMIRIAYNNNSNVQKMIDGISASNPSVYKLEQIINQPFDAEAWNLLTCDTGFFKLSYKMDIDFGNNTFAKKISEFVGM